MVSGMQRFGTSSIPTHSIGLALLQSNWKRAIELILRPRPGESPDAEAARRVWLDHKNLEGALSLMPRRAVAERCVLEAFKKNFGLDTDLQGALVAVRPRYSLVLGVPTNQHPATKLDPQKSSSHVCPCVSIVRMECHRVGAHPELWMRSGGSGGSRF